MFRRQLLSLQTVAIIVLLYCIIYYLISYIVAPGPVFKLVPDNFVSGDKYVFMFLQTYQSVKLFTDPEGAAVFITRNCDNFCFITNNKGFIPMSEYDAYILHDRTVKPREEWDQEKWYILDGKEECVRNKLVNCSEEPSIVSYHSDRVYSLCELCLHLHQKRKGYLPWLP